MYIQCYSYRGIMTILFLTFRSLLRQLYLRYMDL